MSAHPNVPMLAGWGRVPAPGSEILTEHLERETRGAVLSRGLGRSYGDSSLPGAATDRVIATRLANRIISFDQQSGVLRAEAGLVLAEMNRIFMPRGWFTPVTPGTKFVTIGGMVASDVHGKNHHVAGCFGAHVRALRIRTAREDIVDCSPTVESDLFYATIGGMGLLGHILEVEIQLEAITSPWLYAETERVHDIDEFLASLERAAGNFPMSAGWIDCQVGGRSLGRGLMNAGRWARADEAPSSPPPDPVEKKIPFDFPNWAINSLTSRIFNMAYYRKQFADHIRGVVSPEPFFYPLDAVLEWNRVFGSRGFTQYQCVIPRAAGAPAVREFVKLVAKLGVASPVCVIKDCGPEGKGVLSFPLEGTSIAIDMGISADTQSIIDRFNALVIAAGGRMYLTKDRFTRAEHFRAMEPRLPKFLAARDKWDPERKFRSAQSVRLFGDRP